ncbi:MAG TPA: DnaJ domain-containing protein [Acidimicrobiales bacterium]|nr:DnaJ domain-containing protein [Actinomycetes bacterium]MDP6240156.1 DnaJ domain-containing protein [Acidimicrobiales bacterium]MCP4846054.1 DnaJ domain-containing protein [Actinomycetes bacterium]MDP7123668.1 DnaJ domain-containing protein [Acidimicrobiales bacterium]MDP7352173.1 DnaJ domain-containing protein [Acidimicrobiales bacterium]
MPTGPDHHRTFGLPQHAPAGRIPAAYRSPVRLHHPDLATDPAEHRRSERRMAAINGAWHVLGDPARRTEYDLTLRPPPSRPAPEPEYRSEAFRG